MLNPTPESFYWNFHLQWGEKPSVKILPYWVKCNIQTVITAQHNIMVCGFFPKIKVYIKAHYRQRTKRTSSPQEDKGSHTILFPYNLVPQSTGFITGFFTWDLRYNVTMTLGVQPKEKGMFCPTKGIHTEWVHFKETFLPSDERDSSPKPQLLMVTDLSFGKNLSLPRRGSDESPTFLFEDKFSSWRLESKGITWATKTWNIY